MLLVLSTAAAALFCRIDRRMLTADRLARAVTALLLPIASDVGFWYALARIDRLAMLSMAGL